MLKGCLQSCSDAWLQRHKCWQPIRNLLTALQCAWRTAAMVVQMAYLTGAQLAHKIAVLPNTAPQTNLNQ